PDRSWPAFRYKCHPRLFAYTLPSFFHFFRVQQRFKAETHISANRRQPMLLNTNTDVLVACLLKASHYCATHCFPQRTTSMCLFDDQITKLAAKRKIVPARIWIVDRACGCHQPSDRTFNHEQTVGQKIVSIPVPCGIVHRFAVTGYQLEEILRIIVTVCTKEITFRDLRLC